MKLSATCLSIGLLAAVLPLSPACSTPKEVPADVQAAPAAAAVPELKPAVNPQPFTLSFPENPTTGYIWTYVLSKSKIIEETESRFEPSGVDVVGAPGVHVITFEPRYDGEVVATFRLARPWEPANTPAIETFTYRLRSQDGVITILP